MWAVMEECDRAKVRTINWGRLRLLGILSIPLSSEIRMLLSSFCERVGTSHSFMTYFRGEGQSDLLFPQSPSAENTRYAWVPCFGSCQWLGPSPMPTLDGAFFPRVRESFVGGEIPVVGDVFFSRYSQRLVKHHLFMLIVHNPHKFVRDGNYCSYFREMKIEILRGEVTSQLITSLGF